MEKILNTRGLGVSGRQNELIELALTFKFSTVEVDMSDLLGRHDTMGKEFACQFLQSAKINIGAFVLPINLEASDEDFAASCKKLETIFSLCKSLGAKRCRLPISTSSDEAFQPNFERQRLRLHELGERFGEHGLKIGLVLQSPGKNEKPNKFIRTAEEIMTLVKTVGSPAVGLCLNTWQWRASGGGMDQISEIEVAKITELMVADLSPDADPGNLTVADAVIPADSRSFSLQVFKLLREAGFEGPISIATNQAMFARASRDKVVNRISATLDRFVSGEPLDAPFQDFRQIALGHEEDASANGEAADDADNGAEGDSENEATAEKASASSG